MPADNGAQRDWLRPTARVRHVGVSSWKIRKPLRFLKLATSVGYWVSTAIFQMAEFKGPACDIQMYLWVGNGMKDTRGRVSTLNGGVEVIFAKVPASIIASHKGKSAWLSKCNYSCTLCPYCVIIYWGFHYFQLTHMELKILIQTVCFKFFQVKTLTSLHQ